MDTIGAVSRPADRLKEFMRRVHEKSRIQMSETAWIHENDLSCDDRESIELAAQQGYIETQFHVNWGEDYLGVKITELGQKTYGIQHASNRDLTQRRLDMKLLNWLRGWCKIAP